MPKFSGWDCSSVNFSSDISDMICSRRADRLGWRGHNFGLNFFF